MIESEFKFFVWINIDFYLQSTPMQVSSLMLFHKHSNWSHCLHYQKFKKKSWSLRPANPMKSPECLSNTRFCCIIILSSDKKTCWEPLIFIKVLCPFCKRPLPFLKKVHKWETLLWLMTVYDFMTAHDSVFIAILQFTSKLLSFI